MATRPHKRAALHEMRPHKARIIAAISCIVDLGRELGVPVTQYDIVKTLFVADKVHLNKYGRPVTYDNYVAMKDGPVPSLAYNFLKNDRFALLGEPPLPWSRKQAPKELGKRAFAYEIEPDKVNCEALSPSDIAELKAALKAVKSLGFNQVRHLTHEHPAYVEAWENHGSSASVKMSYSLLFDNPNEELARDLAFFSKHA